MIYEKQAKQFIRRMLKEAMRDNTVSVWAIDEEGDTLAATCDGVYRIVNLIFEVDVSTLFFHLEETGEKLGAALICLEHDMQPEEVIADYTDNAFMRGIIDHALERPVLRNLDEIKAHIKSIKEREKPSGLEDIHTRTEPHITF